MGSGGRRRLRWSIALSFALPWTLGEVFKRDYQSGLVDDPPRNRDSLPLPAEDDDRAR
jgi:hypothetical protein